MPARYVPRLVDRELAELLADLPAVLIVGPRACGKTTTAARVSSARLRLDRIEDLTAVRLDPDGVLVRPEPLLIDEWQLEPLVLSAVKRAADEDFRPGRFVLTGSARTDLTTSGWPATGRVVRLDMWGLTVREIEGRIDDGGFVDRIVDEGVEAILSGPVGGSVDDLVDLAFRGSIPEAALARSDRARRSLLDGYVDQLVSRDAGSVADIDPLRLRRYLQAIASNTAGIPTHKLLYDAALIDRQTALRYDSVLESVMATEQLPAWSSNRMARLIQLPKRHLVDVALLQVLVGVDARRARRDPDLLGRVLESFVVGQLRPEVAVAQHRHRLYHARTANGRLEVDVMAELDDGRVVAIEVKADRAPDAAAARHLAAMRDALGDRFVAGVVFHLDRTGIGSVTASPRSPSARCGADRPSDQSSTAGTQRAPGSAGCSGEKRAVESPRHLPWGRGLEDPLENGVLPRFFPTNSLVLVGTGRLWLDIGGRETVTVSTFSTGRSPKIPPKNFPVEVGCVVL